MGRNKKGASTAKGTTKRARKIRDSGKKQSSGGKTPYREGKIANGARKHTNSQETATRRTEKDIKVS
jgi:hypothetical protein